MCAGAAALFTRRSGNPRGARNLCGRRRYHNRSEQQASAATGTNSRDRCARKQQPFAGRSQEHLSKLVRRQVVVVQWHKKDRYGRLVGTVSVKGLDVGLEQLRAGMAWHYRRYENEQTPEDMMQYSAAESGARARRIGLWQDQYPVPPWEWRGR